MKSSEEEVVEDSTNPKDILEGEEVKEEVIEELDQCKQDGNAWSEVKQVRGSYIDAQYQ